MQRQRQRGENNTKKQQTIGIKHCTYICRTHVRMFVNVYACVRVCVSALVCALHVFPLRLPHFNEFLLYVNLFSFEFFHQMASRRAQKCNYAFIKEINCKQCETRRARFMRSHACECVLLKIRQIRSKSKLWPTCNRQWQRINKLALS